MGTSATGGTAWCHLGHNMDDGDLFCGVCGAERTEESGLSGGSSGQPTSSSAESPMDDEGDEDEWFCHRGHRNSSGQEVCWRCGLAPRASPYVPKPAVDESVPEPKKRKRRSGKVILLLVALGLLLGYCSFRMIRFRADVNQCTDELMTVAMKVHQGAWSSGASSDLLGTNTAESEAVSGARMALATGRGERFSTRYKAARGELHDTCADIVKRKGYSSIRLDLYLGPGEW